MIAKTYGTTVLTRVKALPVMCPLVAGALTLFPIKFFDFLALTRCVLVHFDTILKKSS